MAKSSRKSLPTGNIPPMVTSTLMIFLIIGVLAYLMEGRVIDLDDPVTLVADLDQPQAAAPDRPTNLLVTVTLTNKQETGIPLRAPNPCKIFRWLLLTPSGDFVQAAKEEPCTEVEMTSWLEGNHHVKEQFTIELDPKRTRGGQEYQLLVRYWEHEIRTPLILR